MRIPLTLTLTLAISAGGAHAYDRSDGAKVQCAIERNGENRIVPEEWLGHGEAGDRHPALGGAAAVAAPTGVAESCVGLCQTR
jgi:hypothetical protein